MKPEDQNRILKIVKDNYRDIAKSFDLTRKKHAWPELEKILSGFQGSILDVGCGNGRLLDVVKPADYLGLDNSEELIKLARINYPGYKFQVADILDLKTDKKFDLVISVAVLHHLPGQDLRLQALGQLKQAARNKIIFSVWRLWNNKKYQLPLLKNIWLKSIGKYKLEVGDLLFPWKNSRGENVSERYYHAFTKRELRSLLKKAGLKHYKIIAEKHNYWVVIDTP